MLISAQTTWRTSFFFSPEEAQLLFRQLQKLSTRNIAALKCKSQKTKCWVPWNPPSSSSSSVISADLICLSIYALRTDKLYFSSGPRVDECIFEVQSTVPG